LNPEKEKDYVDLTSRIKENFKKFSESQKLIATYLLKHSDKATFFTAANLGKVVGVSESTVVRFADFLGYEGYPALQKDLQNRIKNKLNTVSRLKKSIKTANSGESILYEVFRNDINNIQKKTAAITDNIMSPLAQLADVSVFAESSLNSFIDSFTAPLSLINGLVTAVGVRRRKENLESLSELEEIWEKYKVFY